MSNFKNRIDVEISQAQQERKNIKIGVMALNALYDEITEEQQKKHDDKFTIILESLTA